MGYHPRIEVSDIASFSTIRTRNSELWLINNNKLENVILGNLAKFTTKHKVKLFGFAIEGSHLHGLAEYPECNRAAFKRDLNSMVAKSVAKHAPNYPGGRLWARRYSAEHTPEADDIEEKFFYIALQPIQDGLVDKLSEYPGYNFFHDAVSGIKRKFKVVRWGEYNERRRWDKKVNIKDYTDEYVLKYTRLPGYERLSQAEYKKLMYEKLEKRRIEIIAKRNKPAVGQKTLLNKTPGTPAKNPKVSGRYTHRPRILSRRTDTRKAFVAWYFSIYFDYKDASKRYRRGEKNVKFPPGTYKPPIFTKRYSFKAAA